MRLFPLPIVLLPEEGLPRHIFEDRFKQMIEECLEEDLPFGVVLAEDRGIRQTGCTARVIQVIEKLPDGRMNILTRGERRFRLLRIYSHRPYPIGDVEFLDDTPAPAPAELADRTQRAVEGDLGQPLAMLGAVRNDPGRRSFAFAAALNFPLADKQYFLECASVPERFKLLLEFLEEKKKRKSALEKAKEASSRNGRS
jgi:Lon protease-like protein